MIRRIVPLLVVVAASAASPAVAQTRHNSAAPIDFSAGYIELQDKANRAILSGNVNVRQAEMTLTAARMTVNYTGQVVDGSPQVSRMDASGGVTVTRPDQRARSQYAVYDLNRRIITMLGGVSLVQGSNTVNGGRLTINLDTGRATIDGSAAGGTVKAPDGTVTRSGGRVTGRFSVPERRQ
ncbi:LptA/OstA family protein [Sphingomonas donggukensis]|uniref:LptA/OstA family protein n=1 Tax=Sphingomonas donggukensis TaxID=2949093 RepID=A0ABY4TWC8_9SPHN|nr:LptA/OstA family protein [Sphingomonas donggukensis]URW75807.1 LptA/OstA family protein [Sphingomonas donggukensis]